VAKTNPTQTWLRWLWPPALLCVAATLLPVLYLGVRSFEHGLPTQDLFSPQTAGLLLRSVGLAVTTALLAVAVSTLCALGTSVFAVSGKRMLHVLCVAPLAIPSYVGAATYIAALSPRGPLAQLLQPLGIRVSSPSGFWACVVVLVVFNLPLAYLPIRAALLRTDRSVYEAALLLGKSRLQALWVAAVLPARSAMVSGGVLVGLYALSEFGSVSLLRYDAFPRVIYLQFQSAFDRTQASLNALLLVLCLVVVVVVSEVMQRRLPPVHAERTRPLVLAPSRVQQLAVAALVVVVGVLVLLPVVALLFWLKAHDGSNLDWVWPAVRASLTTGVMGTLLATVFGVPLAVLLHRGQGRWHTFLVRFVDVGFGMPGLIIALGLTFFALRTAPALYQTWGMLALAYGVLYLSLSVSSIRGVLARLPPSQEEAARTLGKTPATAFARVTLPQLKVGVVGGALLVWISCMKELSATLLLIPAGEHTLATRLWAFTDEAMFADAAVPALLLIGIAALGVVVVHKTESSS